ncbi:MAG: hypothetical protein ACU83V_13765 [Gammaproteobacteria bacterium]
MGNFIRHIATVVGAWSVVWLWALLVAVAVMKADPSFYLDYGETTAWLSALLLWLAIIWFLPGMISPAAKASAQADRGLHWDWRFGPILVLSLIVMLFCLNGLLSLAGAVFDIDSHDFGEDFVIRAGITPFAPMVGILILRLLSFDRPPDDSAGAASTEQ